MKGCFSAVHLSVNDFRKAGCRTSVVYDEEVSFAVWKKAGKSQIVSCCIVPEHSVSAELRNVSWNNSIEIESESIENVAEKIQNEHKERSHVVICWHISEILENCKLYFVLQCAVRNIFRLHIRTTYGTCTNNR